MVFECERVLGKEEGGSEAFALAQSDRISEDEGGLSFRVLSRV